MNIKRVEINHFRCFDEFSIELENITSIVGENGSGKTSILDAIYYTLHPNFIASRLNPNDFQIGHSEPEFSILVYFNEPFIAKIPYGFNDQDLPCIGVCLIGKHRSQASPGKALNDEFTATHYLIPDTSSPIVEKVEEGKFTYEQKNGKKRNLSSRSLIWSYTSDDNSPNSFYFDRNREKQTTSGFNTTFSRIASELNWRFRKGLEEEQEIVEYWDKYFGKVIENVSEAKLKETIIPLRNKLKNILGSDFNNFELSLLNLKSPFDKSFFTLRDGFHQLKHDDLGSGRSMVISLVLLDTISQLAGEDIIFLIDEPEMHLHPQLQRKVFGYFSEQNLQIIYTTHSENLIDIGEWKSIKRLSLNSELYPKNNQLDEFWPFNGKKISLRDHLDDISEYYQDRTILMREHAELFFAKACIIVEGPADKYVIDVLSEQLGFDFSEMTVLVAHGKDKIKYFQLLCSAYGIPYFTLFDQDQHGDDFSQSAVDQLRDYSMNEDHHGFENSLEYIFKTHNVDKHKASETMQVIDECEEVPTEIKEALKAIKTFKDNLE